MKRTTPIFFLFFLCVLGYAQQARQITTLSSDLKETSGLLIVDGVFYTFNDSGGEPELYRIDTTSGEVEKTIPVDGAKNKDWEAITADEKYIYIGDIGNNKGKRTNLVIYRCGIEGLQQGSLKAEKIEISYADQTSFDHKKYKHGFDAESLFVRDGELYLISKNWEEDESKLYVVPKDPGSYQLEYVAKFSVQGKVTDAYYSREEMALFLIGYGDYPFISRLGEFQGNEIVEEVTLPINSPNGFQTEGIFVLNNVVYYTSEKVNVFDAELACFRATDFSQLISYVVKENQIKVKSSVKILNVKVESEDGKELVNLESVNRTSKNISTKNFKDQESIRITVELKGGAIFNRRITL